MSKAALVKRLGAGAAVVVAFVAGKEGFSAVSYLDYGNVPTACFGETLGVKMGMKFTRQECEEKLGNRLGEFMLAVEKCTRPDLPIGPLSSYTSFSYNVGVNAFCKSTMASLARQGRYAESCAQFDRWTFIGNKDCRIKSNLCNGIVIRRAEEKRMCEATNG